MSTETVNAPSKIDVAFGLDFSNDKSTIAATNEEAIAASVMSGDNARTYPDVNVTTAPRCSVAARIRTGRSRESPTKTNPTRTNIGLRMRSPIQRSEI